MDIFLLAAILPATWLMFYVYDKDSVEKEPVRLIARMVVLGMIAGPLAAVTEELAFSYFDARYSGPLLIVLEYFIGVALVEEGFKYLFLMTVRKNPEFNYVFDGIVYAVAVALGFAALENILYVFEGGLAVALQRAIFSVPGHFADGVIMGCFFGLARESEAKGKGSSAIALYALALLLPTIEHGIYDSALSADNDFLALAALAFDLAFIALAFMLVKRVSQHDRPIGNQGPSAQQTASGYVQGMPESPMYGPDVRTTSMPQGIKPLPNRPVDTMPDERIE